jgi:hypothetical protein
MATRILWTAHSAEITLTYFGHHLQRDGALTSGDHTVVISMENDGTPEGLDLKTAQRHNIGIPWGYNSLAL